MCWQFCLVLNFISDQTMCLSFNIPLKRFKKTTSQNVWKLQNHSTNRVSPSFLYIHIDMSTIVDNHLISFVHAPRSDLKLLRKRTNTHVLLHAIYTRSWPIFKFRLLRISHVSYVYINTRQGYFERGWQNF